MPNRLYQRQRLRFSKDTRFTELLESVDIAITGQEDDRQVGQTSEDGDPLLAARRSSINLAYNFTDFLTAVLTLYYSHALHPNLYGSYATGNVINSATGTQFPGSQQYPVARDRQDIVLQGDLITKF